MGRSRPGPVITSLPATGATGPFAMAEPAVSIIRPSQTNATNTLRMTGLPARCTGRPPVRSRRCEGSRSPGADGSPPLEPRPRTVGQFLGRLLQSSPDLPEDLASVGRGLAALAP